MVRGAFWGASCLSRLMSLLSKAPDLPVFGGGRQRPCSSWLEVCGGRRVLWFPRGSQPTSQHVSQVAAACQAWEDQRTRHTDSLTVRNLPSRGRIADAEQMKRAVINCRAYCVSPFVGSRPREEVMARWMCGEAACILRLAFGRQLGSGLCLPHSGMCTPA